MKKIKHRTIRNWKDALIDIKSSILKEKELKKANQKLQENALRPYFNNAARHLGISPQQLISEIKSIEQHTKEVLTDKRLKASTYAKLIKKYNPAYYQLFEEKLKSAVKAEQKYFSSKKEPISSPKPIRNKNSKQPIKIAQKLTKAKKDLQKKTDVSPVFKEPFIKSTLQQASQWINVEWHDVIFEDYLIKVRHGANFSYGYPLSESRKSFHYLKKYIKNLRLPALSIFLVGKDIREIKNIEHLKEMVTFLRIKELLIEDYQQGKTLNANSLIDKIKSVSREFLTQLAIASNGEVMCIEYLASQLADGFKPIPAFEIIPSGNSLVTEDTFIFVLERQSKLFLIWESTVHGRATYIFKTDINNYLDVIQAIYDYIASPKKGKRMALRKRASDTSNLCYDGYVTHSAFDHWQQKLEASFHL